MGLAAGTLIYTLTFKENQMLQSDSGAPKKVLVQILRTKAAKVKQSGKFILDAKELFHANELKFKIRNNKLINELLIVEYEKNDYRISSFDKNVAENTIELTLEKINK